MNTGRAKLIQNHEHVSKVFWLTNYAMAIQYNRLSQLSSKDQTINFKVKMSQQETKEIIKLLEEDRMPDLKLTGGLSN